MAELYGYPYTVTGGPNADPGPGGFGIADVSATVGRIALSLFDADYGAHPDLEAAPVGATIRFVAAAPASGEWIGTLSQAPRNMGYWYDIYADFADITAHPTTGTPLTVYLPQLVGPDAGTWVTAAQILEAVGNTAPTTAEGEWAEVCASAINAGFDRHFAGAGLTGTEAEVIAQAQRAGAELYKSRAAPFGVTGYADLSGTAIRLARDPLESSWPVLRRYGLPGFA
jgi:hypothetical protein